MKHRSKSIGTFDIEHGLQEALRNKKRLSVKFQPIIDAHTGQASAAELSNRYGILTSMAKFSPDEFILIAERKGLINQLGYQVFEAACQFLSHYTKKPDEYQRQCQCLRITVTQSDFLMNSPKSHRIIIFPRHQSFLNFTETVILDDNINASNQIKRLGRLGFLLSLDDFGSGSVRLIAVSLISRFIRSKLTAFFAKKNNAEQNVISISFSI
ncbi:EAL domain-containing protein [Vibrio sp. PP-XX7]